MQTDRARMAGRDRLLGSAAYRFPFLWPIPVLPQPEPQPRPLRTEAPAFRLAVSDNMQDPFGTSIPEQGKGIIAVGQMLNSYRTGASRLVHEAVIMPEPGISERLFSLLLQERVPALWLPLQVEKGPRPGRSRPRPLTRVPRGCSEGAL